VLSTERLSPERLGKTPEMLRAAKVEWDWLAQMLAARSGEAAPAAGYINRQGQWVTHAWQELCVTRILGNRNTVVSGRMVGADSDSYADFYREWLAIRCFSEVEQRLMPQRIASWPMRPQIVPVVIDSAADRAALDVTLQSLEAQLWRRRPFWCCRMQCAVQERVLQLPLQADWVDQLNALIPQPEGAHWFYLLRAGDTLRESALLILAERIAGTPGLLCAYSDEGADRGRVLRAGVQTGFQPDLMRAYPYTGRALVDRQRFIELGGFDPEHGELAPHDLLWRLVEQNGPQTIGHIAEIQLESLYAQWLSLPEVIESNPGTVRAHLGRIGVDCTIRHEEMPLINRVDYRHADRPLVSIIIQAVIHCAPCNAVPKA
jgi:hypothetical protein